MGLLCSLDFSLSLVASISASVQQQYYYRGIRRGRTRGPPAAGECDKYPTKHAHPRSSFMYQYPYPFRAMTRVLFQPRSTQQIVS